MNSIEDDAARGVATALRDCRQSLTGELKDAQESWQNAMQSRDPTIRTLPRMERRRIRIEAARDALDRHIEAYGETL